MFCTIDESCLHDKYMVQNMGRAADNKQSKLHS